MKNKIVFIVVICLCGIGEAKVDAAEGFKDKPRVTVQGQGKSEGVPDQARVWVEVSEQGPKLEDITQLARHKIAAVLKAIRDLGIADKDIQTRAYRVAPQIEWGAGKQRRVGFTVSNQVEVLIRDLKKAGAVVSAALDAGANGINGPQYEIENHQALERQALQAALQDAKFKAQLLAKESGAVLGSALEISEGGMSFPSSPRPMMMRAMATMGQAASPPEPLEPGEETVTASVTATYELR